MNARDISTDTLIVGAGPCGIFAAFCLGNLGMKSCIVDFANDIGGQCTALYPDKSIYDIAGIPQILAKDLIHNLKIQSDRFGPDYLLNQSIGNIVSHDGKWLVKTSLGNQISAKTIIIASGKGIFEPRKIPIDGLAKYENKSIFYKIHDKQFFKNKKVIITGGGDSAIDWTIELAEIAKSVILVHRRKEFRAMESSIHKIEDLEKNGIIKIMSPFKLDQIIENASRDQITEFVMSNIHNPLERQPLAADCLLAFFGLNSNIDTLKMWDMKFVGNKVLTKPNSMETSIPSIFAIGDIAHFDGKVNLIVNGFAEAMTASYHIYPYVHNKPIPKVQYSTNTITDK